MQATEMIDLLLSYAVHDPTTDTYTFTLTKVAVDTLQSYAKKIDSK
jgi:hypothetical protein